MKCLVPQGLRGGPEWSDRLLQSSIFIYRSRVTVTMPGDRFAFGGCDVFRHHQPISEEDMASRALVGLDGAFREYLRCEGVDYEEPTLAMLVQTTSRGDIQGCRAIKCGKVKPSDINTRDFWPEAEEGKLCIPEFDISIFDDYNGCLTSPWTEVPFKVKVKNGQNWQTVKAGVRRDRGFGDLVMRINFVPITLTKAKFLISALPVSLAELGQLGEDTRSRAYPTIKIYEGRANLASPELENQRWGLGIQPFFLVADAEMDQQGELQLTNVTWPSSAEVKIAVTTTLRSAIVPNWHAKVSKWAEVVKQKKWSRRVPDERWSEALAEDEEETEEDNSETESDGEHKYSITRPCETISHCLARIASERDDISQNATV